MILNKLKIQLRLLKKISK